MNISMTDAQRSKDENKRLRAFSKLWSKGETWMVFYPLGVFGDDNHPDVIVNATYGNKVNDFEGIGLTRTFIPYNGEIVDGRPKNGCLANDFARLSRAILKGEETMAVAKLDTNKLLAKDPDAKAAKVSKIHEEFKKKDPALGGFTKIITTECVGVKLNEEGVPDPKTAALASQELSGGRVSKLQRILTSPLTVFTAEDKYLVVIYAFGTQDRKQEAGDVDPIGVATADRPWNKYPEIWQQIKPVLETMASDSDMIGKRNFAFTPVDDGDLLAALRAYMVDTAEYLDAVTDDASKKTLKASIKTLKLLGVDELQSIDMSEITEAEAENAAEEAMKEDVKEADENPQSTDGEFEVDADLAELMKETLVGEDA